MVIRSSSSREIDRLVAELADGPPVRRDAAVARLRVIGPRAVDRLAALVRSGAAGVARVSALKALDGIPDGRVRDVSLAALGDIDPAVVSAAVMTLRGWLASDSGVVLDALTTLALDRQRPAPVRLAALDALSDLPKPVIQPLLLRLAAEDPAIAARAAGQAGSSLDHPAGIRDWLNLRGADAPLSELHQAIAGMRERERNEPSRQRRQEWQAARGAAHHALARRDSRVALYDLRETFDAATEPLPLDFLHAAARIGDASSLEALARAWAAAARDAWWRSRLAETAAAIVAREKVTARHAAVKRIRRRYPGFLP